MRIPLPWLLVAIAWLAASTGVAVGFIVANANDAAPMAGVAVSVDNIPTATQSATATAAPEAAAPPTETPTVAPTATARVIVVQATPEPVSPTVTPIPAGPQPPPIATNGQVVAAGKIRFQSCLFQSNISGVAVDFAEYQGDRLWRVFSLLGSDRQRAFEAVYNEGTGSWAVLAPRSCVN